MSSYFTRQIKIHIDPRLKHLAFMRRERSLKRRERIKGLVVYLMWVVVDLAVLAVVLGLCAAMALSLFPAALPTEKSDFWLFLGIGGVLSALIARTYFLLVQDNAARHWTRMMGEFDKKATPDNGVCIYPVALQPQYFEKMLPLILKLIPANRAEIMIVLQHFNTDLPEHKFETNCLKRQVEQTIKKQNNRAIDWVCFIDCTGRFAAFQNFARFRKQLCQSDSGQYVAVLNAVDTEHFYKALDENFRLADVQQNGGDKKIYSETNIPHQQALYDLCLKETKIVTGPNRRQALQNLMKNKWAGAMMVTEEKGEPIGIVTVSGLLKQCLMKEIESAEKEENDQKAGNNTDQHG